MGECMIKIKIEILSSEVVITKLTVRSIQNKTPMSIVYWFTDYKLIPRDVAGVYQFFNDKEELLYYGRKKSTAIYIPLR